MVMAILLGLEHMSRSMWWLSIVCGAGGGRHLVLSGGGEHVSGHAHVEAELAGQTAVQPRPRRLQTGSEGGREGGREAVAGEVSGRTARQQALD